MEVWTLERGEVLSHHPPAPIRLFHPPAELAVADEGNQPEVDGMTNERLVPFLLAVGLLLAVGPPSMSAQPSNLEAFQQLAVECLVGAVPDTVRAFRLEAPDEMPYVRTALVARWQNGGRRLYVADTSSAEQFPALEYEIERADVTYARERRRTLRRTVTLALRYTLTTAEGHLLRDARCRDAYTDTVRRDALPTLETTAFPETQADPPPGGWLRRYVQPAVVAAATAVTVYLFFSLRSDRADN